MLTLFLLSTSFAVPVEMNHQGRLLDSDSAGLTGSHLLTFAIYDAETSGTLLWQTATAVSFENGYYSINLGADGSLDSDVLKNYPVWLELTLDTNPAMSPRHKIGTVPFSVISEVAESVEGPVDATEISVNGVEVIDADGNWVGPAISGGSNSNGGGSSQGTGTVYWTDIQGRPQGLDDGDDSLTEGEVEYFIANGYINLATGTQIGGANILTENTTLQPIWTNILNRPPGLDDGDDILTESEVEYYITNGPLSLAAGTQIGGANVLNTSSLIDWSALTSIPSGLSDGDDILTESEVENYITNGSINLNSGSKVDNSLILTQASDLDWNMITDLPDGLDDGDDDTLTSLSCTDAQVVVYDETLEEWFCEDILNVLAGLGCDDGNLLQWDDTNTTWECVAYLDTQLSESTVESYITNSPIDLASNSTMGGNTILTDASTIAADWNQMTSIPSDFADKVDNVLDESTVEDYVTNSSIDLATGTTIGGDSVVTTAATCNDGEILLYDLNSASWVCGEDSAATLTATELQALLNSTAFDLAANTTMNGSPLLTSASTVSVDKLDTSSATSGQVLQFDGTSATWAEQSSSQTGCTLVDSFTDGPNQFQLDCGGTTVILSGAQYQYTNISASRYHVCGIRTDGTAVCWGRDNNGQSTATTGSFLDVATTESCTVAIKSDNTFERWGSNCVNTSYFSTSETYDVLDAYSTNSSRLCGITTGGEMKCTFSGAPSNSNYTDVAVGSDHVCYVDVNSTPNCFGSNSYSQRTPPAATLKAVSSGEQFSCGIKTDSTIVCWGNSNDNRRSTPSSSETFVAIDSGYRDTCAVSTSGGIRCWGMTFGSGSNFYRGGTFTDVAVGFKYACGIRESGAVECWGDYNSHGQMDPK